VQTVPGPRLVPITLSAADGVQLFVYHWLAEAPPRGVVQIVHGMAEHGGRYARLASALTADGYAVYAGDHRGHGRTARGPDEQGFFAEREGWRKCIDDLWLLNRHIAVDHPGLPIVLLGHSMGSFMAQDFISQHGDALAGVVLCGSNGKPPPLAMAGRLIARIERLFDELDTVRVQNIIDHTYCVASVPAAIHIATDRGPRHLACDQLDGFGICVDSVLDLQIF